MCVIIHKPEGVYLTDSVFENSYKFNKNGWGILWVNKFGKLKCKKNITDLEDFYKNYELLEENNLIIHFRAGANATRENCHPFMVNKNLGFVHNGHITGFWDKEKSDTNMFNENFLKPLIKKYPDFYKDKQGKFLISKKIGFTNKLAFMDSDNKVTIINKKEGAEEYGCWFSNTQYKPYVYTYNGYVPKYVSPYTPPQYQQNSLISPRDYSDYQKLKDTDKFPVVSSEVVDEVDEVDDSYKNKEQCDHCLYYYNNFEIKKISANSGDGRINLCKSCIEKHWSLYINEYEEISFYY